MNFTITMMQKKYWTFEIQNWILTTVISLKKKLRIINKIKFFKCVDRSHFQILFSLKSFSVQRTNKKAASAKTEATRNGEP